MKHLVRIYTILFVLFVDFTMIAQIGPGDDDGGGDLEGPDAPINGQIIWLVLIGIAFAFYFLKKYRKASANS
jgi:hypothetical protein